jgi:hypothetical protein
MSLRATDALNPELVSALGRLVIQHAAVEEAIRDCIVLERGAEDGVAIQVLLAGLSFSTLVEKYGAIYYEFHPGHRSEIGELCTLLCQLNERRNQFVHSFWHTGDHAVHAIRMKSRASAKKGLVLTTSGVTPEEVEALAWELHEVQEKLWEFSIDLSFSKYQSRTG